MLSETLQRGLGHADKTGNSPLHVTITKTLENLKKLEEKGLITSSDNYASFLREVALEVANRQSIREQQKKEVRRLTATVKNLQTIQQCIFGFVCVGCMWGACGVHVGCMWGACGVHVGCMWGACGVHVGCMWV
jgi:hypothetical protein